MPLDASIAQPPLAACIAQAAQHYGADQLDLARLVVLRGGRTGEVRHLGNGDVELGLARIPGREADALRSQGYTRELISSNDCLNVGIAAYLLKRDSITADPPKIAAQPRLAGPSDKEGYCTYTAAQRYSLPVDIFRAVILTEGGWNGLKRRNTNNSYDLGRAQINTIHLPELARYGVSEQALANDVCVNLHVAAYRLRFEMNRAGDLWRGVGNYHSRTPTLSARYQARVKKHLATLGGGSIP